MRWNSQGRGNSARQRGVAMLVVIITLTMASILAMSFLTAQSTSTAIAQNVDHHARARAIAESALVLALRHVQEDPDWRQTLHPGAWLTNQSLEGGDFTLWGYDGQDEDGDGQIDGDGDLADDPADPFTLTARGRFQNATHTVSAVVSPQPTGGITVLMIVPNAHHLSPADAARRSLLQSWGFQVNLLDEDASSSAWDDALAQADVAYISDQASANDVDDRLTDAAIGVVCEQGRLNDELEITSRDGQTYAGTRIDIDDADHDITRDLGPGDVTISSHTQSLYRHRGSLASGARVLASRTHDSSPTLVVVDAGDTLRNHQPAPARRVLLPWGDDDFDVNQLTDEGRTILRRALEWAASDTGPGSASVAYGVAALGSIKLSGAARIDSFDSSRGPYGGANVGHDAIVATNGDSSGVIDLSGSAQIHGSVLVGPGADPDHAIDLSGAASVWGDATNLDQTFQITADAPDISGPATDPDLPSWGQVHFGVAGAPRDYHWEEFDAGGSVTIYIDGPVRALVDDDFHLGGGARLIIASNASLTLYVRGEFELTGSAQANMTSGDPALLTVYVLDGDDVEIQGSAMMYGAIVAPQSDAEISGAGRLYGAFQGQTLQIKGSGALHQDVHLTSIGGGGSGGGQGSGSESGSDPLSYTYRVRWIE